jgi:hypothetical protein
MYVSVHKYGYGACGGAALSALFEVMIRKPFFIIMRDATVQLCCCVFLQSLANWSHREQPGAKTSCNHCHIRQCLISAAAVPCAFNFQEERLLSCMVSYDPKFGPWRRNYDVSRASWKLFEENFTTYQGRLGRYLKKYDVSKASGKLLAKMLRPVRNVLEVTWKNLTTYQ